MAFLSSPFPLSEFEVSKSNQCQGSKCWNTGDLQKCNYHFLLQTINHWKKSSLYWDLGKYLWTLRCFERFMCSNYQPGSWASCCCISSGGGFVLDGLPPCSPFIPGPGPTEHQLTSSQQHSPTHYGSGPPRIMKRSPRHHETVSQVYTKGQESSLQTFIRLSSEKIQNNGNWL